jgi:hypothetical protein
LDKSRGSNVIREIMERAKGTTDKEEKTYCEQKMCKEFIKRTVEPYVKGEQS